MLKFEIHEGIGTVSGAGSTPELVADLAVAVRQIREALIEQHGEDSEPVKEYEVLIRQLPEVVFKSPEDIDKMTQELKAKMKSHKHKPQVQVMTLDDLKNAVLEAINEIIEDDTDED